ncbi:MAG TPA: nitrate- and nitrite sensing domain-containing protein [Streptomyces sp.]|nr:nitrate- and nitrite sensing domain-containing protein [Streptomyces sp.]
MQGRLKRNGSAVGDPELRGVNDRGSSPQRAQESGPPAAAHDSDASAGNTGATPGDGGSGKKSKGKGKGPSGPGSRLALRNWRISTRLVSLLALPVVAATTLGALRIDDSLANVDQLEKMKLLTQMTEHATELAAALQEERDKSAGPLISTGNEKDDAVVATREATDLERKAFRKSTESISVGDDSLAGVQATVVNIQRQLGELKTIRENAYDTPEYSRQTVERYNQLIESLLSLSQDMAQATSNSEVIQSTRALAAFSSAKEYASIQRAIISAGLARKEPQLSQSDRLYAKSAMENEKAELDTFSQIYGNEKADELLKPLHGGIVNITAADTYRKRVLNSKNGIKQEPRSYLDWYDQDRTKIDEMGKIERSLLTAMEQQARTLRSEAQYEAYLNLAVILLVLGVSLVGAFVVARSMVRSLRRLQDTAQEVSRRRLPELVKQMSESDPQDVDTSVESVGVHSRDEIGRVAAAFDDVHREAVRLAGEQALLRGNVNAMFTNLSRRSQGLIQRQLSLISELESREADPDQLSSLFKLDHLATRMRRNGENLLVLAGEEPGRRWTRPVPLVDVLRAAASEVEQYERIELSAVPTTEVAGRVVNDLVHLLAELLENATSFSSPQTKVKVTGHALPDGRVLVEIHDTGIGLSPEDLSSINERLANPPTVDVSVSRRMGLFVVGRLSLRHGIRIQLRPSDSGGTTALVMLPVDVAQGAQAGMGKPGAPLGGGPGGNGGNGGSKAGNIAAALQRDNRPAQGAGAAPRLGSAPDRGQVGGGAPRPALPGAGPAPVGGPPAGRDGNGLGGLPTRPVAPGRADEGDRGADRPAPLPTRGAPVGELPGGGGPGDTQQFERPSSFDGPPPARGPETGVGAPGQGYQADQASGEYARPSWAQASRPEDGPRGHEEPEPVGETTGGHPVQSGPAQPAEPRRHQAPPEADYGIPAVPPAGDDVPTPIFSSMESNWFNGRRAQPQSAPQHSAPASAEFSADRTGGGLPRREGARGPQAAGGPPAGPGEETAGGWGASPNDERWRRAEQVRQPAAGGVTTSGLPRRVPRANLVAGTAQQQSSTARSGPAVSRAPADVRGRLTNLRRGIQQGRQAGNGPAGPGHGVGPTYQQER